MQNTLIIILVGLLLISATVVTTTQIVQPKPPTDIKIIYSIKIKDMEVALNTYRKFGYTVKSLSAFRVYLSYEHEYVAVIEKY